MVRRDREAPSSQEPDATKQERFSAWMALAAHHQKLIELRQRIEWRLTFGSLVGVATFTYYGLRLAPGQPPRTWCCAGLIAYLALAALLLTFMVRIQQSMWRDLLFCNWYKQHAERVYRPDAPESPWGYPLLPPQSTGAPERWRHDLLQALSNRWPWVIGHVGIVMVFAAVSYVLVFDSPAHLP